MSDECSIKLARWPPVGGQGLGGELLSRIWSNLRLVYVAVTVDEIKQLISAQPAIPREDLIVDLHG